MNLKLSVCLLLVSCMASPPPPLNSVEVMVSDMTGTHEVAPHGVPEAYDWAAGPRLGYGNTPPADFTAIIPWGQVYECHSGNEATNTRVELKGLSLHVLQKSTGRWWTVQQNAAFTGAAYREDFVNNENKPAHERPEPSGGVSVKPGDGFNYHFYTWRETIDPADIAGVLVTLQARLVLDDANRQDDRPQACFVLSVGADYWRDLTAPWKADFSNNGDVAIGKFKRVTVNWKAYNMVTVNAGTLKLNPPPLE